VDDRSGSTDEAVRRYVAALREIRGRLFADFPGVDGVSGLLTAVRATKTLPREGRSASGIEYSVHGAGCRMTDERGRTVDVDLVGDVEAFEQWRIKWFLDEGDDQALSEDELLAACVRLVDRGELRQIGDRQRWFALPLHG
jgi:hypothetical protein